ncbi:DUF3263 domain-containing protein [Aestuariimicrobium sp. p3-SID1156]|uniref:DUF3263 domain-containing protein n=1 Tax=Aestuariimicrobium sp. p3-SID1156 TaxID=2916038 RepID=UPI00223B0B14|nr:DUF3263 domain-containing protein [Aestuariimicrobium sp. p3-SID1156]MCT1458419.1 DUF3263 domain-containing protein [Aestuariimicrobium sp. p3-SID1156]
MSAQRHMSVVPEAQAEVGLSDRDAAILAFEKSWWAADASKASEIRERFNMSTTAYHQILNGLLDNPHALAAEPLLVKRLRRLRESRQKARSASRLTHHG